MIELFKHIQDWQYLDQFDWIKALEQCPQEPRYHGEGNVLNHTKMVLDQLLRLERSQSCSEDEKTVLMVAAVMHDIGKPSTTRVEEDGIHARHHAQRGAIMTRGILWKMGVDFLTRETIAALVRFHMKPSHMFDNDGYDRKIVEISLAVQCRMLGMLCNADALGRIASDLKEAEEKVLLFEQRAKELDCFEEEYRFYNDYTRLAYFTKQGKHLTDAIHNDTEFTITMMSGLPASGKDYWISKNLPNQPMISLDEIRNRLGVSPTDDQAPVIRDAKEQAKKLMGKKVSFVYNATNLSRDLRSQSLALMRPYNPYIRIVYVEAPCGLQYKRNAERSARVPESAVAAMLNRWEMPELTEAHDIQYVIH